MIRNFFLHPLLVIIACALQAPAAAQFLGQDALDISRTCLWNADHTTWSELHVKRAQIERLNEIRLRYPAVVDGRWLPEEEDARPKPAAVWRVNGSAPAASPAPATGLQAELRGVLSKEQLSRWHLLCAPPPDRD